MKRLFLILLSALIFPGLGIAKTNSIIEAWNTTFTLAKPNELVVKELKRIKILDEDGYQNAIYYDYHNSFRKIKSLKYTVYDASLRRVKKMSKSDALDLMVNPSYEVADARLVILDPEYRSYPFTVEIEVEIAYDGFLDFPEWMPRFTHDVEVKQANLTLECYKDFGFRAREINGVRAPSVETGEDRRIFKWSVSNLASSEKHLSRKSFDEDQAKVLIAPVDFLLEGTSGNFQSWADFGDWYYTLNKDRNSLGEKTRKKLAELRKAYENDQAGLIKAVYKLMQSQTRYISIQLGIGGYQTIPSDVVEKTGYGDCKALTNYMKAMLDYLNIPSYNVLIQAGQDVPDILSDFPSNQFNHVFLAVPQASDTLWFECTSQTMPPGYIGTFTDDRHALWIQENNSKIIHTPVYDARESFRLRTCIATISGKGDAELHIDDRQSGFFYDESLAYEHLTTERIEKFNYDKFRYKDFSIKSFKIKPAEKDLAHLNLEFTIFVNGLAKSLGDKMVMPVNLLTPFEKEFPLDYMNRKTEIRRAFALEDSVIVKLPDNFRIDVLPENFNESSEFGDVMMSFKLDANRNINITRKIVINKGKYTNGSFDRFTSFVKKVRTFEQGLLVLKAKT